MQGYCLPTGTCISDTLYFINFDLSNVWNSRFYWIPVEEPSTGEAFWTCPGCFHILSLEYMQLIWWIVEKRIGPGDARFSSLGTRNRFCVCGKYSLICCRLWHRFRKVWSPAEESTVCGVSWIQRSPRLFSCTLEHYLPMQV